MARWSKMLLICVAHSLLLLAVYWVMQLVPFTTSVERNFVYTSMVAKRTLNPRSGRLLNEVLLVDVSGSRKLVSRIDRAGADALVDRAKIAAFLKVIQKSGQPDSTIVLCDVLMNQPTEDDSAFAAAAKGMRLIMARKREDKEADLFPNIPKGYADVPVSNGVFLTNDLVKYRLMEDSTASLPLAVYEMATGKKFTKSGGLVWGNGCVMPNQFVINFRLRDTDLLTGEGGERVFALDDLLAIAKFGDSSIQKYLDKKLVVLGDFKTDVHPTIYGQVQGPIVLVNVIASLYKGDVKMDLKHFSLIFLGFILLSWLMIFPPSFFQWFERKMQNRWLGLFVGEMSVYFITVWTISFLIFITCQFQLEVLVLTLYLTVIGLVIKIKNHKKKKA